MICPAGAAMSVVTRTSRRPGSVTAITRTGRDRNTPGHRQRRSQMVTQAVLPYRVTGAVRPGPAAASSAGVSILAPLVRGRPRWRPRVVQLRVHLMQAGVARQRPGQRDPGGKAAQLGADIGAVRRHVHVRPRQAGAAAISPVSSRARTVLAGPPGATAGRPPAAPPAGAGTAAPR